jgi:hypothetical protein
VSSLPQRRVVLTRGFLALAICSGFSVFQNRDETSAHVARAYDFPEIKDLKSVTITISASEYAFFCCYYYSLSIHGDGRIEYYGHLGSFVPGLHRSRLSEAEILRLLDAFRAAGFYSLHDESNLLVMDAPSISIELSADGYSKTVTDRLGESKAFGALMDRILEISHAQRWLQKTPDTLQAVLADTENLNTADDDGRTVLMWACQSTDVAAVRELIRSGADVRAKDKQGRTVLMYAAASQSREMIDALLHSDAGVNEQDSSGKTALHFAASLASPIWNLFDPVADYPEPPRASFWPNVAPPPKPKPEVVALLLAAGADSNAADYDGATPMMYAAEVGTAEVLRVLLAARADLNAQDAEGRTALMYAADHRQTESVRLLVEAGADVTLKDNNGYTALKRVQRKVSRFSRRPCGTSRKEIIHILRVAHRLR